MKEHINYPVVDRDRAVFTDTLQVLRPVKEDVQ